MKRILLTLAILGCMTLAHACVPEESPTFHRYLTVTNNSDRSIYLAARWFTGDEEPEKPQYLIADDKIESGKSKKVSIFLGHPKLSMEENFRYGEKLKVVYVDAEIRDAFPHDYLEQDNSLLGSRVFYTIEELQAIDFHLYYPDYPLE